MQIKSILMPASISKKLTPDPHPHRVVLDGWRGVAISMLLIGHFFPLPGINLGSIGVNLFFVLSGLLMGKILFLDQTPIQRFYRRRISRVFPTVFFFVGTIVIMFLVAGHPVQWKEVAAAALFLTNYFPGTPGAAEMPFGHIWSLCVEEHSYVVLGCVAILARAGFLTARRAVSFAICLNIIFGVAYWLTYHGPNLEFDLWMHSEVSSFGIFVSCLSLLYFAGRNTPQVPALTVPGLILLGLVLQWWSIPAPVRTYVGVGALALAVNLLDQAPPPLVKLLSWAPLRALGKWSFSIYLWQQPFYLAVHREGMPAYLGVTLALFAGISSFYLFENPSRLFLNRVWGGNDSAAVRTSASI